MNLKKLLSLVILLIILIAAWAGSVYLRGKVSKPKPVVTSASNVQSEPAAPELTQTYDNPTHHFSFKVPGNFKTGLEDFTYLPYGNNAQVHTETHFYHEINTQYCALSGECRPTTYDMEIGAAVISTPLSSIQKQMGSDLQPQSYGDLTAYVAAEGVEGEGMYYYFIALDDTTTLMLYRTYIDESVVTNYQTADGFIKFDEQSRIMTEVLKSLTISK